MIFESYSNNAWEHDHHVNRKIVVVIKTNIFSYSCWFLFIFNSECFSDKIMCNGKEKCIFSSGLWLFGPHCILKVQSLEMNYICILSQSAVLFLRWHVIQGGQEVWGKYYASAPVSSKISTEWRTKHSLK